MRKVEKTQTTYKVNILATNNCNAYTLKKKQGNPDVCAFCFRQETEVKTSVETIEKLVSMMSILPIDKKITVTGGEPLISEYIVALIKLLKEYEFDVSIHTNGICLGKYIDEIADYIYSVSLPYDGNFSELADYYRGEGFFNILEKNINILKQKGIKMGFHTLLTPKNIVHIESMAAYLIEKVPEELATYWYIKKFKKINTARNAFTDIFELNTEDYYNAINKVNQIWYSDKLFPTPKIPYQKKLFVDLTGDVYVFDELLNGNTKIGNFVLDEFASIINNLY